MTQKEFINLLVSRGTPRDRITIENGLINVNWFVDLSWLNLTEIPYPFGFVTGDFFCNNNHLTTLLGSPKEVGGGFNCNNNQLITLNGAPIKVGYFFTCSNNQLINLQGAPKDVGGDFYCAINKLTNLNGSPLKVGGDFNCYFNQLTNFDGIPNYIGGELYLAKDFLFSSFFHINTLNIKKPKKISYHIKF